MELDRLKSDLEAYKHSHSEMNRLYIKECASNQHLKNEINMLLQKSLSLSGMVKKSSGEAERYYGYLINMCNGEMTFEQLKETVLKDKGPTKYLSLGKK